MKDQPCLAISLANVKKQTLTKPTARAPSPSFMNIISESRRQIRPAIWEVIENRK